MKNLKLQQEIIIRVFQTFGISFNEKPTGIIQSLISNDFLHKQKINFTDEEETQYQNSVWAAKSKVENSEIKIIILDLKQDNIKEYLLTIQMDQSPAFLFRLSEEAEDFGDISCFAEKKWISTSPYLQAKALVGVEGLSEVYLSWNKLENIKELYQNCLEFLKLNDG